MEENLSALFFQDHPDYQLAFVVESESDPACAIIWRCMTQHPQVAARLIVAGVAVESGQKVHNLRAATEEIDADVEAIAFVDSDARPRPQWLRTMVGRLDKPGVGAVTGYRWFLPARNTLANLWLGSLNAAVAGLFGPGGHYLVWGGSWAVRRDVFEATALRDTWHGTLSDDLVASRTLHGAGLRCEFEPMCLAASPLDVSLRQAVEFVRRQYLIGRHYAWRHWAIVTSAIVVAQLGQWSLLAFGIVALAAGHVGGVYAMGALSWVLGSAIVRAALRQDVARRWFPQHAEAMRVSALFDILTAPVMGLVNAMFLAGAAFGHTIRWRGIGYHMTPGGRVLLLGRRPSQPFSYPPNIQRSPAQRRAA